jgi:misacylated tRNA(Ala) deacylase
VTKLLFLEDSYLKEFSAEVLEKNNDGVVLDQTAFFPQGGGQPFDRGKLFFEGKEFRVLEVKKDFGKVWHNLESAQGLEVGAKVTGKIDWKNRFCLMRMHTSAHIIAAVIFNSTGKLITGNQLGWPESRMDFNADQSFNLERVKELEKAANAEIAKNLEVKVSFLPREKALENPALVRLKDAMPPALKKWRIVKIGSLDIQADGGTHVKNSGEIGLIEIIKTQNKGAGNKRIYWRLK